MFRAGLGTVMLIGVRLTLASTVAKSWALNPEASYHSLNHES